MVRLLVMPASHCPEVGTRWTHEYVILNFARRWPRTLSRANQQPKQVRCIKKVMWWHPNHTRWFTNYNVYTKATQIWEFSLMCLPANATRRRTALQNCSTLNEEDALRLAFYVARYTHETRELPNSAVFANIVVPSQCHRTIIRWLHIFTFYYIIFTFCVGLYY